MNKAKTISYAGIEWTILEEYGDSYLCISKNIIFKKAFDGENDNNWSKSSLRAYLNGEFINNLAKTEAFLPFKVDLTADNGLTDYGTCEDRISLITCNQFRKYRYSIPPMANDWWTSTPWCTKNANDSYGRYTCYLGYGIASTIRYIEANCRNLGVSPVCLLSKDKLK